MCDGSDHEIGFYHENTCEYINRVAREKEQREKPPASGMKIEMDQPFCVICDAITVNCERQQGYIINVNSETMTKDLPYCVRDIKLQKNNKIDDFTVALNQNVY